MNYQPYLDFAKDITNQVNPILLQYFDQNLTVEDKADGSPVTIADREGEKFLREKISQKYPNHALLGEEYGTDEKQSDFVWAIDPIDGTKYFVRGLPFWGSLLTLFHKKQAVVAIVSIPALGIQVYAADQLGCFDQDGNKLTVSQTQDLKQMYLGVVGLDHFENPAIDHKLLEICQQSKFARTMGNAYCLTQLAMGKIDAIIDYGGNVWDYAPGQVIVSEAGGQVSDLNGNKISFDSDSIVAANQHLYQPLMDQLHD